MYYLIHTYQSGNETNRRTIRSVYLESETDKAFENARLLGGKLELVKLCGELNK